MFEKLRWDENFHHTKSVRIWVYHSPTWNVLVKSFEVEFPQYPSLSLENVCWQHILHHHMKWTIKQQKVAAASWTWTSIMNLNQRNGTSRWNPSATYRCCEIPDLRFLGLKYRMTSLCTWICNGRQLPRLHDDFCFTPEVIARRCVLLMWATHVSYTHQTAICFKGNSRDPQ